MPALRISFCGGVPTNDNNNSSSREQPQSSYLLSWWIAGDDLRGIAKYALLLRCVQLLVLIPVFVMLILIHTNNIRLYTLLPCDVRHNTIIVWSFWSLSLTTILCSIVLEIFIFRVASRGSPTEVEERRSLSCLCTLKVIPLSMLRIITVILAMYTLTILNQFCDPSKRQSNTNIPCTTSIIIDENDIDDAIMINNSMELESFYCPPATTELIAILAYTHITELSIVALIALVFVYANIRKQQNNVYQWWTTTTQSWKIFQFCRRRPSLASSSSSSKWHGFCRCCCVCTSCCTCCIFGGAEVYKSSTNRESSLSDIAMILSDFFDTGNTFDITPSDLLVGFTALGMEQRQKKEERLEQFRLEIEKSKRMSISDVKASDKHTPHGNNGDMAFDVPVFEDDIERGSHPVVTIRRFATGSYHDNATNENGSSDLEQSPNDDDTRQQSTLTDSTRTGSSVNVVQDLQMCREDSQVFFKVTSRKTLNLSKQADRKVMEDGAYYMRYALAVYGHLRYLLQDTCTAPCCLVLGCLSCRAGSRCGTNNESIAGTSIQTVGDNYCGCNELGFLLTAGLYHCDLVYASYKTGIKTCPYVIVVDNEKKSIVIAIKGTFSLESLVTDLNIRPELLHLYADDCDVFAEASMANEYCHSGMLQCALHLYKDLERHKLLDQLLLGDAPKLPNYSLILTGHSLGAGCAAVLAIMLRNKFPNLRCLCFAPPGCVTSLNLAQDHRITSYVLGSDMVPRLSYHSVVGLRNDVLEMIARVRVPKHVVLGRGTGKPISEYTHRRDSIPLSPYYAQILEFKEHQDRLRIESKIPDVKLYPPGKIVHIVENRQPINSYRLLRRASYIPIWAEKTTLQKFY